MDVVSLRGMALGHWEKQLTTVRTWFDPIKGGNGSTSKVLQWGLDVPLDFGSLAHDALSGLQLAKFVFIHRDAHHGPLQRPYDSPFKDIQPASKTFLVDIGGKFETISVDRLKPAHVDLEQPVQVAVPRPLNGLQRPPTVHLYFSIQTPSLAHSHSTLILYIGLGLHDDTSRFWGEWCSRAVYISRRRTSLC